MNGRVIIAAHDSDRVVYPDEAIDLRCTGTDDGAQITAYLATHPDVAEARYAPGTYSIGEPFNISRIAHRAL